MKCANHSATEMAQKCSKSLRKVNEKKEALVEIGRRKKGSPKFRTFFWFISNGFEINRPDFQWKINGFWYNIVTEWYSLLSLAVARYQTVHYVVNIPTLEYRIRKEWNHEEANSQRSTTKTNYTSNNQLCFERKKSVCIHMFPLIIQIVLLHTRCYSPGIS